MKKDVSPVSLASWLSSMRRKVGILFAHVEPTAIPRLMEGRGGKGAWDISRCGYAAALRAGPGEGLKSGDIVHTLHGPESVMWG